MGSGSGGYRRSGNRPVTHSRRSPTSICRGRNLAATMNDLLPRPVVVEAGPIELFGGPLLPLERALIAGRSGRRRREYTAGRVCSRRALARLRADVPGAVGTLISGQPAWPVGVVGSITHRAGNVAAAVTTDASGVGGLGIDLEVTGAVPPDLASRVCTPTELVWIRSGPLALEAALTLVFSAKESVYKAAAVAHDLALDFHDIELTLDLVPGTFTVAPQVAGLDALMACLGTFAFDGHHTVTAATLPTSPRHDAGAPPGALQAPHTRRGSPPCIPILN